MEKVKVSKEVADTIEKRKERFSFEGTMKIHANRDWECDQWKPLNSLTYEELATAWLVGYEVEKTPEEKIAKYYEEHLERKRGILLGTEFYECQARLEAIEFVLYTLGIKIEGVNA